MKEKMMKKETDSAQKGGFLAWLRVRIRHGKTHCCTRCPQCGAEMYLPKIQVKRTVCCPCCGDRFEETKKSEKKRS